MRFKEKIPPNILLHMPIRQLAYMVMAFPVQRLDQHWGKPNIGLPKVFYNEVS